MEDYGSIAASKVLSNSFRHKGNSAVLTAGLSIADVVGAGVLAMGPATANLGWLLGSIVLILLLAMNIHITLLIWRVYMEYPQANTLTELASAAFAKAPAAHQRAIEWATSSIQSVWIFAALALYTLTMGKGLGMIFYDAHLCLPVWTLIGCLLILPGNLHVRSLGEYSSPIWINIATTMGTCLIPIVWLACQGVDSTRSSTATFAAVAPDLTGSSFVSSLCTYGFAFCGQFIIVEIMSEMENPAEFPKAYAYMSGPVQAAIFLFVGLGVYYYRGSEAHDLVLEELPFNGLGRIAAGCLVVHMTVTFVIKSVIFCQHSVTSLSKNGLIDDDSRNSKRQWYLSVLVVVSVSWLVAQIVPFFEDLVNLMGAALVPIGCFILPILYYLRLLMDKGFESNAIGVAELLIIQLELALSVVILVYGIYTTSISIMDKWASYGPPFACHCEDMWDTCSCSASRVTSCSDTDLLQLPMH